MFKGNETTCEGHIMNLTCTSGNIFVEKAVFGRTEGNEVCDHSQIRTTNCKTPDSEVIVKGICDGKPQCSIAVNTVTFGGDPFQNTYKYVEVNFICY